MSNKTIQDPACHARLLELYATQLPYIGIDGLADVLVRVMVGQIVHDYRKRDRVLRDLLAAGWIQPAIGYADSFFLTSRIWEDVKAAEPTYIVCGWYRWHTLPWGARKFVLDHPDRYRFGMQATGPVGSDDYPVPFVVGGGTLQDQAAAAGLPPHFATLLVASVGSIAAKAARDRQRRIDREFRNTLPWALCEFAGIPADLAEDWTIADERSSPSGSVSCTLHSDPAQWVQDATAIVHAAEKQAAEAARVWANVQRVLSAVETAGGWDVLAAKLRAAAIARIDGAGKKVEQIQTHSRKEPSDES